MHSSFMEHKLSELLSIIAKEIMAEYISGLRTHVAPSYVLYG